MPTQKNNPVVRPEACLLVRVDFAAGGPRPNPVCWGTGVAGEPGSQGGTFLGRTLCELFVVLNVSFSRAESMRRLPSVNLQLIPHGRCSEVAPTPVPPPPATRTHGCRPLSAHRRLYKQSLPRRWPHTSRHSPSPSLTADAPLPLSLPTPLSPPTTIVERYPGDGAAANGFGRRHLHESEARLLCEADYPAAPDMRVPG